LKDKQYGKQQGKKITQSWNSNKRKEQPKKEQSKLKNWFKKLKGK